MNTSKYDPDLDSVKDRCQVIMLYEQANRLRQSPAEFSETREKADAALSAWLEKYGSKTSSIFSSRDDQGSR